MKNNPPPETGEWKNKGKRKNTKKWCKGKVGVEHIPAIQLNEKNFGFVKQLKGEDSVVCDPDSVSSSMLQAFPSFFCYHHVVCLTCDKELDYVPPYCPTTGIVFDLKDKYGLVPEEISSKLN